MQTPFLFSKAFALCGSEDRIRVISIKNDLVCGRAEDLANDRRLVEDPSKRSLLSASDENVSRKFESCAQFPYLLQCELPLPRQEHGDGAL